MKIKLFLILCFVTTVVLAHDTLNWTAACQANTFLVKVPANTTTGYQLTLKSWDKTQFKSVSHRYIAPNTQRIGAGGVMVFTFKLRKGHEYPHKTTMYFLNKRPWESNGGITRAVLVDFTQCKK